MEILPSKTVMGESMEFIHIFKYCIYIYTVYCIYAYMIIYWGFNMIQWDFHGLLEGSMGFVSDFMDVQ